MRVIAGEFGGRRLAAPRGKATRPTSDRVREALFMTLEPLAGLQVVDLFAGSGALGIEALSRGAARADFVEPDLQARRALERNLAELGIEARARVWSLRLPRGLSALKDVLASADVILADPPYGGNEARAILRALGEEPIQEGARVVVEHHAKDDLPEREGRLARARARQYGETVVSTYRIEAEPKGEEEG
jgi:16S rRNA (guanine(966)-N(2))-methyltransferase RsmD